MMGVYCKTGGNGQSQSVTSAMWSSRMGQENFFLLHMHSMRAKNPRTIFVLFLCVFFWSSCVGMVMLLVDGAFGFVFK